MNKKGFAVSGMVYAILLLFLFLIIGLLSMLGSRKMVLDKLKNDVMAKLNGEDIAELIGTTWEFDYTGGQQTFTVPMTGIYKLETWGAQGGSYDSTNQGGYGAYSVGNILLQKNSVIYINVGGQGNACDSNSIATGGYNGGGNGYCSYANSHSGGGATHIAYASGQLYQLSTNVANILIVSGGGGGSYYEGASAHGSGGSGGGYIGNSSSLMVSSRNYSYVGYGGSQSSGGNYGLYYNTSYAGLGSVSNGSFGKGGSYSSGGDDNNISGGGAGYYGGGAVYQGCAAGGSSYIANTLLTDKKMHCYNCTENTNTDTYTVSTTCYNSTPTANCAKQGNGYAKITYIGN